MRKNMKLEPGLMYRIVYKQQLGNYQWYEHEMFAKYVGPSSDGTVEHFSLRPLAGTQDFDRDQILEIYEQPRTCEPRLPKKLRRMSAMK